MTKWFVVADKYRSQPDDPDDCVWTLSRNPDEIGWETDSGCPGYGLLKKDAEELVGAANRIENLEAALRDFLLWGDHCQHCDYDDEWAKIEVRARKALGGNNDPST